MILNTYYKNDDGITVYLEGLGDGDVFYRRAGELFHSTLQYFMDHYKLIR